MAEQNKVVSLKFVTQDGDPVDYVMIEGEDIEQAKEVAARWAEQNLTRAFDRIEEHQGVMRAPEDNDCTAIDGVRIWPLPF
jgi:hypothetical protein